MQVRHIIAIFLTLFLLAIALQSVNATNVSDIGGTSYMVPTHPKIGDTITIYYQDPDAENVTFSVCSDTDGTCYIISETGKTENGTWWAKAELTSSGRSHYTINATYVLPDGNTTYFEDKTYFTVAENGSEDSTDEGSVFPLITITGIISASALLLVSYWAWRRHNR